MQKAHENLKALINPLKTPLKLLSYDGSFSFGMKYIIMCGGPRSDKPLREIYNEALAARTIRLLRENGIQDIAISTNDTRYEGFGVPVLRHNNSLTWEGFCWLHAFYPMTEPVCYLYGDVFYSPEAIRTIVEAQTDDIEFFGSAPPFDSRYTKRWAEPFAFKVQNTDKFFECINRTIEMQGRFNRHPISWELWQVIKNTAINKIDYTNYTAINDYTADVDDDEQALRIMTEGYGKE